MLTLFLDPGMTRKHGAQHAKTQSIKSTLFPSLPETQLFTRLGAQLKERILDEEKKGQCVSSQTNTDVQQMSHAL